MLFLPGFEFLGTNFWQLLEIGKKLLPTYFGQPFGKYFVKKLLDML